ncbi:TolB family protein [Vibrio diabolicus]|uniref:TolB family protein n=1 Tax=Vibrio diabolicus TaxID=50719 RepID=UPI0035A926EF
MKKTLLITLLGLAIIGCNDQSQQSASPVSSSAQTEQEKHPDRVYVGEQNYYVMESAVTNENWVSDDKIKPMPGQFPKYYVFNSDEWPKEDINDASSYDLPRFQFAWDNDDDDRVKLKIWSMKTDGTDLRLVVPDTKVDGIVLIRRSPNLRYVAWIDRGTGKYVYDLKTGEKTRLIGGGSPGMTWSEDSRYLYFHTMPGQNFDVDNARWDSETGEIEAIDFGVGPYAVLNNTTITNLSYTGVFKRNLTSNVLKHISIKPKGKVQQREWLKFRGMSPLGRYAWGQNDQNRFFFDIENETVKKYNKTEYVGSGILGKDARFSAHDRVSRMTVVDRKTQRSWQWYALGTGEIGVNSNMSLYNGLANDGLWFKESQ